MDTNNLDAYCLKASNKIQIAWQTFTNAIFQGPTTAEIDEIRQEQIAKFNSWLWHFLILACAIATVALLWRIAQQKKKEPFAAHLKAQTTTVPKTKGHEHENEKVPTDKQHRLTIPPRLNQQSNATDSTVARVVHPDSRYMPKI